MEFEMISLEELANVTKLAGFEFTKYFSYNNTGEIIAIRGLNIKNGRLSLEDIKRIDKHISDNLLRSKLYKGEIVLTYTGTIGNVAIIEENDKFHLAPNVAKITINENNNPYFYYSYFTSEVFRNQLNNYSVGSSQPTIPMKNIRKIIVPNPPIIIQNKIANLMKKVDDKINTNIVSVQKLEQITHTLFKRWFIDFEFPNEDGQPYKSSDGKMIESELGLIPEGWIVLKMGSFLIEKRDKVGELIVEEYSCTNSGIQLRDEKFKKALSKNSSKNKLAVKGDMVFGMSRKILNFGVMKAEKGGFSSAYNVYSINSNTFLPLIIELFMRTNIEKFADLIRPGAREGQGLDKGMLTKKTVIVPDIYIQSSFVEYYNIYQTAIEMKEKEIESLLKIRNTLLPKLLSGEIELPDETEVTEHVPIP